MKCPKCNHDLETRTRFGIEVDYCTNDHGMWLDFVELSGLENEAFKEGEHDKGSLMLSTSPSNFHCPKCGKLLRQFQYRFYDLTLEYCENLDGFWLDAGEEQRILDLMKSREEKLHQKSQQDAELREVSDHLSDPSAQWNAELRRLQSKDFFKWLIDRLQFR